MTEKEKGEKKKLSKNKDMVQWNEKVKKKKKKERNNIREIQKTRTRYGKSESKKEFLKIKNGNA